MAKNIKFKSTNDNALPEEERVVEITDTVETVSNFSAQNLLLGIEQCDEMLAAESATRDALIDDLQEIVTALSLSITVPTKS